MNSKLPFTFDVITFLLLSSFSSSLKFDSYLDSSDDSSASYDKKIRDRSLILNKLAYSRMFLIVTTDSLL